MPSCMQGGELSAPSHAAVRFSQDETRRLLLLQNAAFLALFRGNPDRLKQIRLDELQAGESKNETTPTTQEIFAVLDRLLH